MRSKWYVGHCTGKLKAFSAINLPTEATHGDLYKAVIGPFKTKRAALWTEQYGQNNPHFQHVNDAERLSQVPSSI